MALTIIGHQVRKVVFGPQPGYSAGILTLEQEALRAAALKGTCGAYDLELALTAPGEKTRIVHITDIIKPSYKSGGAFPGWTGRKEGCGSGTAHQLEQFCVTQTCVYPGIQEGIVDMSGPAASYSPFSRMIHLVLTVTPRTQELEKTVLARDLVRINVQAAEYTASLAAGDAGVAAALSTGAERPGLPRIGYAYFIQAQGPLRNVFLLGEDCVEMSPRLLPAEMILDGALVSGNYIIACQKNPTYLHQENPIIRRALQREGDALHFVGAIVSTESNLLEGKRENARRIAQLAKEAGMEGILITQEGGGHADVDLMLTVDACEAAGIPTVMLTNEIAGPEGTLPPLTAVSQRADAVVTTGNNAELTHLPAMDRALGGTSVCAGAHEATEAFETSLGILYTATNQLGASRMTSKYM